MKNGSPALPYVVSFLAGLVICLAVAKLGGRREPWDTSLYFVAGIPLMCVVTFALAFAYPARPWRWVVSMAVGQSIALLMGGGSLSLWPLAIVAMVILLDGRGWRNLTSRTSARARPAPARLRVSVCGRRRRPGSRR